MDQQLPEMEVNLTAARRSSRGRQKIKIEKIENQKSLDVTFSKRRKGLFKKAMELAVLCGTPSAAIVFSRSGRAFSIGNPSVDAVLDCYLARDQCEINASSDTQPIQSLLEVPIESMQLPELLQMLEALESIRGEMLQEIYTLQATA